MPALHQYVVVWRDTPTPGARLRTYTNPNGDPYVYTLDELTPSPEGWTILDTSPEVEEYLASTRTEPVLIQDYQAIAVLGWSPVV